MAARNIDIILGGLADAIRSRDPERIAEFLGPDLVWEGLEPGLRCDGRQQAMTLIRNRFAAAPLIVQAVEAIEAGQHVIVGLRGPDSPGRRAICRRWARSSPSLPSARARLSAGVTS